MKVLVLLIFTSSSVIAGCLDLTGESLPMNNSIISKLGGVKCVNGETSKFSKEDICKCHTQNQVLNLKANPRYKEIDQEVGKLQLERFINQFKKNITTTIDNAFSVSQFVTNGKKFKSCDINKMKSIEKKCKSNQNSILAKHYPDESIFGTFFNDIKDEYDQRLSEKRLKKKGYSSLKKKCDIPDAAGYMVTGVRAKAFTSSAYRLYGLSSENITFNEFLRKNKSLLQKEFNISSKDFTKNTNYIINNPAFKELLESKKNVKLDIEQSILNQASAIEMKCAKSVEKLEEVLCLDKSKPLKSSIKVYKDIGMADSELKDDLNVTKKDEQVNKSRFDIEMLNQVRSEHMCENETGKDIADDVFYLAQKLKPNLTKELFRSQRQKSLKKSTKERYIYDSYSAVKKLCKYNPNFKQGYKDEKCEDGSLRTVCMDLFNYINIADQDKMLTKLDSSGNPVIKDGEIQQVENPNYINLDDTINTLYGKKSFVGSFFNPEEETQTEVNKEKLSSSGSSGATSTQGVKFNPQSKKSAAIRGRGTSRGSTSDSRLSDSSGSSFSSGSGSAAPTKTQRYRTKVKNKMDELYKHLSDRVTRLKGKGQTFNPSNTTSSGASFSNTTPSQGNSIQKFDSFADNSENEYNEALNETMNNTNKLDNSSGAKRGLASLPSGANDKARTDFHDRINPLTGLRNPGLGEGNVGELSEIKLFGVLEDDLTAIDPALMINIDPEQEEILKKLKSLIQLKKPFYISKRGDHRYRFLVKYIDGKYVVEDEKDLTREYANFNKEEYLKFKKNIEKSLNSEKLSSLELPKK